jgi:hypothetical protein
VSNAVLYNVFTCWMVTLIGLAAARDLFARPRLTTAWRAFSWFWTLAAILWALAGLRLLAYYLGLPRLDRLFFYGDEFFVALHLAPAVIFVAESRWADRRLTVACGGFVALFSLLFFVVFVAQGITRTISTDWASEHELPRAAFFCFLPAYLFCVALVVYSIISDVAARLRSGAWPDGERVLATAGMLVYSLAGIADVRGIWAGWRLLLIRVVYLTAALTAFWIGRSGRTRIEVVRGGRGE